METKEILKQLRKEKGYSAKEVSNGCDMSLGVYKKYESGERGVGTPALCKLADFFGVTTDYLLGREPKAPKPNSFADMNLDENDEKEVIAKYMSLPPEVRAMMLDVMLQLADAARSRNQIDVESNGNPIQKSESPLIYCGTVGEELERRKREEEAVRKDTA